MDKGFSIDEQVKINALWNTFREYCKILVHELSEDLDLDDLGNIFVRTNFGGTRIRGSDIYSTTMAISQRELVRDLRNFCAGLPIEIDYGILIRTFVAFLTDGKVKLASRVLEQAAKLKGLLEEKESQISDLVQRVKDCVQKAEDILVKRGIRGSLPTENVMPVMSFYIYKKGGITPEEEEGLFNWFVLASYFGRYSASAETRLDEDLGILKSGGNYGDLIKRLTEREGNLQERIKTDLERGERDYWLLLFALLRQSQAKDPIIGENLNTANIAIHHLFPRKFVAGSKFEDLLNNVGNITLLTPGTNQSISAELPENYLKKWPQEQRRAHYIPQDRELWKFEEMRNFVEEREKLLKGAVEKFFR